MKHLAIISVMLVALCAALTSSATQYSCLSIITEAKAIGKWHALKAWIAAADLEDEWGKCQYVSDDYPQFAAITNALVSGGIVSDSEVRGILEKAADTAVPDSALRRVYNSDVSTSYGRGKWHGKLVRQIVDTNSWTRVSVYEDGTRFTDRAGRPKPRELPGAVMTNGIPARLAAARARLAANRASGNVTNVTVNVRAGQ